MARSDKVPFRREFILSAPGYAGSDEGFFVGDILSLHIDIDRSSVTFILEGRVGRDGVWEKMNLPTGTTHKAGVDVREFEYVRLQVLNVRTDTRVTLFGYENNVRVENQLVTLSNRDYNELCESKFLLEEIKNNLEKLNMHMAIITGEEHED
jgi:hypothetical protein